MVVARVNTKLSVDSCEANVPRQSFVAKQKFSLQFLKLIQDQVTVTGYK